MVVRRHTVPAASWLFADPPAPAQRHSATSRQAAAALTPAALRGQRLRVMDAFWAAGDGGLTDEGLWDALGRAGKEASWRRARVMLVASGHLRDSGRVRANQSNQLATVWQAKE